MQASTSSTSSLPTRNPPQSRGRPAVQRPSLTCGASTPQSPAGGDAGTGPSDEDIAGYKALVSELAPCSVQQLREAAAARPAQLMDSRFLFWLRDRERRPGVGGGEREMLGRLGQELTMMREWTEEQANRKLLPSLATSLAYSTLRQWREETGKEPPQVVAGVDLDQLYRMGETEERKLRESLDGTGPGGGFGGGGMGPRKGPAARSPIEEFTKHNKAYADLAAGAMARVRSRLMGFDDDGPSAAQAVLRALLRGMGSSEERATFLPDAFTPPGLEIFPDAPSTSGTSSSSNTGGSGGSGTGDKPKFVVTTPDALAAAVRARQAELAAGMSPPSSPAVAAVTAAAAAGASSGGSATGSGGGGGGSSGPESSAKPRWRPGQGRPAPDAAPSSPVSSPPPPSSPSSPEAASSPPPPAAATAAAVGAAAAAPSLLPCGEDEAAVLTELLELIDEYDRQVFSRKTPLERMGHSAGPWMQ